MTASATPTAFTPGSIVRARGREWIVLADSDATLLSLRPLGGADDDITGIDLAFEGDDVHPANFAPPTPNDLGDHASARLLQQALRLSVRDGAGPFRSFGRIAVEPRPYQLVPLLMGLRLDPVRLLIADDVGIGKTVEALLVARELLDRGEIERIAVLAPPHLAEQWHTEMQEKFHLDAALVLPSTAARLERGLPLGQSLFDREPIVIVSTDFIKSDRHVEQFRRAPHDLVIVDEAHTAADPNAGRGSRHQRARLVRDLARDISRHLILVTATPHSGNEVAFRELLAYLDPGFADLPDDLSGPAAEPTRRRLAQHLVQRRRAHIRDFLDVDTPFPDRLTTDETYKLTPEYERFFQRVLAYARETVRDRSGSVQRQRVRWWSVLALLRAIGSSPAAAASTLRERSRTASAADPTEADELGRASVLDLDEEVEGTDVAPGADPDDDAQPADSTRRRLLAFARDADALAGTQDAKLAKATAIVRRLVDDGNAPIVFCRFIATAEYVRDALRKALPNDVEVVAVTGAIHADQRRAAVDELGTHERRVLVATDCLSEGINLQEHFDAVVHYDLSWNPTRHEQREGRVDRYGQRRPEVKVVTLYGSDNPIDGIVLAVLLRKHKSIRGALGISVPVPVDSNAVLEAILEGILIRGGDDASSSAQLSFWERQVIDPGTKELFSEWDRAADREQRSRSLFAQHRFADAEVIRARDEARAALGDGVDVRTFTLDALRAYGVTPKALSESGLQVDLGQAPRAIRDLIGLDTRDSMRLRFQPPTGKDEDLVGRTHPVVAGLTTAVVEAALDPVADPSRRFHRAGVIRTQGVARRTCALLLRLRFDLRTRARGEGERLSLAEEVRIAGFTGNPGEPIWLDPAAADALLDLRPSGNVHKEVAQDEVIRVTDGLAGLIPALERLASQRAADLDAQHERVRDVAALRGRTRVEPRLPIDILGIYVFLPA